MPVVLPRNSLEDYQNAAEWRNDGVDTWASGSDNTATGYDTDYAFDGFQDAVTKPASSANGSRSLLLDLSTTITDVVPSESNFVDGVVIAGHNFSNCGGTVNVYLEYDGSGNADFSDARIAFQWLNVSNNKRLVGLNFGTSASYSAAYGLISARYWRLRITSSSNFGNAEPEIGELMLSRRRQMSQHGVVPYKRRGLRTRQDKTSAKSGISTVYQYSESGAQLPFTWRFAEGGDDTLYGLDEGAIILAWFRDCAGGSKPFYYIEDPISAPQVAYFMRLEAAELDFDKVDNILTAFSAMLVEEAPNVFIEQYGTS